MLASSFIYDVAAGLMVWTKTFVMQNASHFELRLAQSAQDIRGAGRLRYRVFVEELGGNGPDVDHDAGIERDAFDAHSDQLILVDPTRDPEAGDHVVGVYRLMRPEHYQRLGRYYSDTEYDLSPLLASGRKLLELGRSCVDAEFRGGTVMFQLWQGLAGYVAEHEIEILFGVASFHGTDPHALAQPLSHLHHAHLAPAALRPKARRFQKMDLLAKEAVDRPTAMKATPSLIKAYLRLGGVVGEGAYIDEAFNTVDVCLVLDTARMSAKHRDLYTKPRA